MPRKKRQTPATPEQIAANAARSRRRLLAARDKEFAEVDLDGSRLLQHANVNVRRERGNVRIIQRIDAFEALREGMPVGAYDAARRLERDITIRRGEHDHGRPGERVQGDEYAALCRNDQIIAAAERVERVMKHLSPRDQSLLTELIVPVPGRDTWRAAVEHITGETAPHGQAAAVRAACVNLRDAYNVRHKRAA